MSETLTHEEMSRFFRHPFYRFSHAILVVVLTNTLSLIGFSASGTRLVNASGSIAVNSRSDNAGTKPYPIVGDWTGSSVDAVGVFDRSNGQFTLCTVNATASYANNINQISLVLGIPNDLPLSGHWQNSTSGAGVGMVRPSNGLIYLKNQLVGYADNTFMFGIAGDVPIAGHWQVPYPQVPPAPVLIAKTADPKASNSNVAGGDSIGD